MRKIWLLPAFAIASCLLASCYQYTTCPAFDRSLVDAWFPYEEKKVHYFSAANGQTDTMVIGHVNQTSEYIIRHKGSLFGTRRQQCEIFGTIDADKSRATWLNMHIRHTIMDKYNNGVESVNLRFKGMDMKLQAGDLQAPLDQASYRVTVLENMSLNDVSYEELRLIEPQNTDIAKSAGIDKLYIARGKGFIGYRTCPAKTEYWLK